MILDRKLLRDLTHLTGQMITIALVVAAGLAGLLGMYSTLRSIDVSVDSYYRDYRFAEIFAHAKRAPEAVGERIGDIPGVRRAYTRIVEPVTLPMEEKIEPGNGRLVSIPEQGRPPLNDVYIRKGRMPEPGRTDEVLVLESFADANDLEPGDELPVVMGGTLRDLRIVGIALSPEFVFLVTGKEIVPDYSRSTVLWMRRDVAEAAFRLEGAFNDVVLSLQPGASKEAVIDAVDRILDPYGGLGAHDRDDQASHRFVVQERTQLRSTGIFVPMAFLLIAAFLLNVVLSRLIQLQRSEIATLKAVGYSDPEIGWHYFKFVLVVVTVGALMGAGFGYLLGDAMTSQYADFFNFPSFVFTFDTRVAIVGAVVTFLAGTAGAAATVLRVMRLPPAEAMRPPAPPTYEPSLLERMGLYKWFSGPVRMIVRELERRPLRFLLSWIGIALSVALMVVGRFGYDSVQRLITLQFSMAQREDISVSFANPVSRRAERELESLPGVLAAESQRSVPVRMSVGHRERDTAIVGYPAGHRLRQIVDADMETYRAPESGMLISEILAEILEVEPGDFVRVEVREGQRKKLRIRVEGVVDDVVGLQGYMQLETLNRRLGEPHTITDVVLDIDSTEFETVYRRLRDIPAVIAVDRRTRVVEFFRERLGETFLFQTLVLVLIASVMTIGVVYNNARVALSTRGRDLASMRVLGFTQGEVTFILLGEQAIQVLAAIPVGWWLGGIFSELIMMTVDPENFRLPVVVSSRTYAFALLVTVGAAIVSGLLVWRRLRRMDITEVLKTRE